MSACSTASTRPPPNPGRRVHRAGSARPARPAPATAPLGGTPETHRPPGAAPAPDHRGGRCRHRYRCSRCRSGERDAQHPKHHVGRLEAATGDEERARLVAQHRAAVEAPEEGAALLHELEEVVRPELETPLDIGVREAEVRGVDRLPHLGGDHVAHRPRALTRAHSRTRSPTSAHRGRSSCGA